MSHEARGDVFRKVILQVEVCRNGDWSVHVCFRFRFRFFCLCSRVFKTSKLICIKTGEIPLSVEYLVVRSYRPLPPISALVLPALDPGRVLPARQLDGVVALFQVADSASLTFSLDEGLLDLFCL